MLQVKVLNLQANLIRDAQGTAVEACVESARRGCHRADAEGDTLGWGLARG